MARSTSLVGMITVAIFSTRVLVVFTTSSWGVGSHPLRPGDGAKLIAALSIGEGLNRDLRMVLLALELVRRGALELEHQRLLVSAGDLEPQIGDRAVDRLPLGTIGLRVLPS